MEENKIVELSTYLRENLFDEYRESPEVPITPVGYDIATKTDMWTATRTDHTRHPR